MPRINLTVGDDTFAELKKRAENELTTVSSYIHGLLLKELNAGTADPYITALEELVNVVEEYVQNCENGEEFTLAKLKSFADICYKLAIGAKIRPSSTSALLGRLFYSKVMSGNVSGVERAFDSKGNKKFFRRTVVYVVKKE